MTRGAQLLAAVYATPDVDAPRRVYADWLLAQGDPRGEFIHRQLAGPRDDRVVELERANRARWLGGLEHVLVVESVWFERGFPYRARCKPGIQNPEQYGDLPAWATMRHLERPPLALVRHPGLRRVRSLSLRPNHAGQLVRDPTPLPHIESLVVTAKRDGAALSDVEREWYEGCRCLPGLRKLHFSYFRPGSVMEWAGLWTRAFTKLRAFGVTEGHTHTTAAGEWAQAMRGVDSPLERLTLCAGEAYVVVEHIEPGDWARATTLVTSSWAEHLVNELTNLVEHGIMEIEVLPSQLQAAQSLVGKLSDRVRVIAG